MVRKKIKEEVRQPDFFVRATTSVSTFVREHRKRCIIATAIFLVLAGSAYAYKVYDDGQSDKAQYALFESLSVFQEYQATQKADALTRAEEAFKKVLLMKRKGPSDVAKLYLGRIALLQGKPDAAATMYGDAEKSSTPLVRDLARSAAKEIEKK